MRTVIVYGGAFNPPTLAHAMITQAVIDEAHRRGSEVWLLPSGERRDKSIGVKRSVRLRYMTALLEEVGREGVKTRIETFELDSSQPTDTTRTVKALRRLYPDCQFTWVFGSDSIMTMHEWPGGQELYRTLSMLLIARPGYLMPYLPPHAYMLSVDTPQMSSTEVRKRLVRALSVADLVPRGIAVLLGSR